jgi:hypothetical protein
MNHLSSQRSFDEIPNECTKYELGLEVREAQPSPGVGLARKAISGKQRK